MDTHFAVQILDGGGLARGMHTCSGAYATEELARQLGRLDPHLQRGRPIALTRVETVPHGESRRLVRAVILEVLPGLSGEPEPAPDDT